MKNVENEIRLERINENAKTAYKFVEDLADNILEGEKIIAERGKNLVLRTEQHDYIRFLHYQLENMYSDLSTILNELEVDVDDEDM